MNTVQGVGPAQNECHRRATSDFQRVLHGKLVDLVVECQSHELNLQLAGNGTVMVFPARADTAELAAWILMPEGKQYQSFRIIRYDTGKPEKVDTVKVVTEYLAEIFTIIAFKLLSLKAGYTDEVSWFYR
jgi:hypothetical protein